MKFLVICTLALLSLECLALPRKFYPKYRTAEECDRDSRSKKRGCFIVDNEGRRTYRWPAKGNFKKGPDGKVHRIELGQDPVTGIHHAILPVYAEDITDAIRRRRRLPRGGRRSGSTISTTPRPTPRPTAQPTPRPTEPNTTPRPTPQPTPPPTEAQSQTPRPTPQPTPPPIDLSAGEGCWSYMHTDHMPRWAEPRWFVVERRSDSTNEENDVLKDAFLWAKDEWEMAAGRPLVAGVCLPGSQEPDCGAIDFERDTDDGVNEIFEAAIVNSDGTCPGTVGQAFISWWGWGPGDYWITGGDMILNNGFAPCNYNLVDVGAGENGIDEKSVVLHELGHILGLGHSGSCSDEVMYYSIPWSTRKPLGAGDILGIRTLYESL